MIESRELEDVKACLSEYPNIKIVSRDGSRIYAAAITEALPKAKQISDRFHLMKNLTDYATLVLQKLFQGRVAIPITDETKQRRAVMLTGTVVQRVMLVKELYKNGYSQNEIRLITGVSKRMVKKYKDINEKDIHASKLTARERGHIAAVEKLQQRAVLVHALKKEGLSITAITQRTGFCYDTVPNYLFDDFTSVNAHYGKQREGKLEPFREEVFKLKSKGLKYREIHEHIKEKGYSGTQDAIREFVSKERRIY